MYLCSLIFLRMKHMLVAAAAFAVLPFSSGAQAVPDTCFFRLDGKYVLLTQDKSWNSGKIYTFISDTTYGPWRGKTLVYRIPDLPDSDWYTYNAMAHPQFEDDGRILVSYNVNSNDFSDHKSDVESYRPRFIWVDKKLILGLNR